MTLTDSLEAYVCFILTVEFIYDYIWNTRENRIKRRKASAKKERMDTSPVSSSSGKKDVEMVSGQAGGLTQSQTEQNYLEMRRLWNEGISNRLRDEKRPETQKD